MTAGISKENKAVSTDLPSQSSSKKMYHQNHNNRKQKRRRLKRLVSQDELAMSVCYKDVLKRVESPLRCVSEFDKAMPTPAQRECPPLPNPLEDPSIRNAHIAAIRLEANLHPMRLILSRLMAHPQHNRKGLFNHPVDPVALELPDYHLVVTRPIDLGTVKKRLHAVAYQSRDQVAEDIRTVFSNAMRYNPPHNSVHQCAKELLANFEEAYEDLDACVASPLPTTTNCSSAEESIPEPLTSSRAVSCSDEDNVPACAIPPVDGESSVPSAPTSSLDCMPDSRNPGASQTTVPDVSKTEEDAKLPSTACLPVHTQASWLNLPQASTSTKAPRRKSRLPPFVPHTCQSCQGRTCAMCKQGCLFHEPALLVCQGFNCGGAKIRKGAQYFTSKDGNRQFCPKCFVNLPPVLPNASDNDLCRYKQDLLKRKNDEEIAENWLTCSKCSAGVHAICAMHNDYVHESSNFLCFDCETAQEDPVTITVEDSRLTKDTYTFVSGSDSPVPISSMSAGSGNLGITAESLPKCAISSFIEEKVRECMKVVPNADKTITVRVISDCSRQFNVPDVVRKHFRMATESDAVVTPPSQVKYRQKAITLFQKIDGLDVCIYCMYVQEYDGDDQYESEEGNQVNARHSKRVYIAYLDSVEHFRPRQIRTDVYHEILISYLATARQRGYDTAQIWACPPSRGNNFVFWNHPASQRTPTKERLVSWYHGALSRAIGCGVITDVKSLFETEFQEPLSELEKEDNMAPASIPSGRMVCPPLLDGDFWIEEAVRLHNTNISRNLKIRSPTEVCVWNVSTLSLDDLDPCPALQLATLIKDRIMTHPSSVVFRRPVNAVALKLKNYHQIITQPMDLGTIYSRCVLGEYQVFREMVEDVELMVANAKKFNPVGHFVHVKAGDILDLFYQEISGLTKFWETDPSENKTWESYAELSMSLDMTLEMPTSNTTPISSTSVVIEDDRSSDGSRSMASSVSLPASPVSRSSSTTKEGSVDSPSAPKRILKLASNGPKSPMRRNSKKTKQAPRRKLDLLSDGPEAVFQRMAGDDVWLLDKRNPALPKSISSNKKSNGKRRRSLSSVDSSTAEPVAKKRRQSWLGEEVSGSVRNLRTSFFTCSLAPKSTISGAEQEKLEAFKTYAGSFEAESSNTESALPCPIADARSALLEFSQYRHLEFDTLRRAKYSTAMLLYHIKHENAPGVVPVCTSCDRDIEEVRWHKVKKVAEKRRVTKNLAFSKTKPTDPEFIHEELCGCCHAQHSQRQQFIPIPVSLKL